MSNDIHSCSYYCDRPACIKAQRDELREKFIEREFTDEQDLIYRLRKRAEIRRQIDTRKSVQEGKPDRIAELLEEAADRLEYLEYTPAVKEIVKFLMDMHDQYQNQHNYYLFAANLIKDNFGERGD